MKMEKYFTTRDLTFIGLIIAAETGVTVITHLLAGPLLRTIGLRITLVSVFFVGIVLAIGIAKVKKVGTLSLIGISRGIIAGFILPAMPILFLALAGAGIFADMVVKLFHLNYSNDKSIILAVGLNRFILSPLVLIQTIVFDLPFLKLASQLVIGLSLLEGILGAFGACFGLRIVKELKKAGVIK